MSDRPIPIIHATYLRPGQAHLGMVVAVERSGNRFGIGHITAISEEPEHRHPHQRICTVRVGKGDMRDNECDLLVDSGRG